MHCCIFAMMCFFPQGCLPPFFPGILLSRKPPESQGKRLFLKRTMNQPLDIWVCLFFSFFFLFGGCFPLFVVFVFVFPCISKTTGCAPRRSQLAVPSAGGVAASAGASTPGGRTGQFGPGRVQHGVADQTWRRPVLVMFPFFPVFEWSRFHHWSYIIFQGAKTHMEGAVLSTRLAEFCVQWARPAKGAIAKEELGLGTCQSSDTLRR